MVDSTNNITKKKKHKTAIGAFAHAFEGGEFDLSENSVKGNKNNKNSKMKMKRKSFSISGIDEKDTINVKYIEIETSKCSVWPGNSRDQNNLDRNDLEELKASIKAQGQKVPVLVRPLSSGKEYEVIYGSRRFNACKELGITLKALSADISDKDAINFMVAENSSRKDTCAYENALSYKEWLDKGIYKNQQELAESLSISRRQVTAILRVLKIPKTILDLVVNKKVIGVRTSASIMDTIERHPEALERMRKSFISAGSIESEDEIHKVLKRVNRYIDGLSAESKDKGKSTVLKDSKGVELLNVKIQGSGELKIASVKTLSPQKITQIINAIEKTVSKI